MTRELSRGQAALLGSVILIGLALGTWMLWTLDQRRGLGVDSFQIEAGFADVRGIQVGARVHIQGMDAGEVEGVEPPAVPGQEVRLRMRLRGQLRHLVTNDARVQIASENMLTGKIVRILPGTAQAGQAEDGTRLASAPAAELTESVTQATAKLTSVLNEVDGTLQELRQGRANVQAISQDLAQSSAKLNRILTQVDVALADLHAGKGTLGKLLKDETLYHEMTTTLGEVKSVVADVRQGEGTIGKLVKDKQAYADALQSLQDVRQMVVSVKQNSDAIKSLPVVRSYVVDAHKELIRPECERHCKWYRESDLFEPGRAVLTSAGRKRLDEAAAWLAEHKEASSEVVVAAFAAPEQNAAIAKTLTQKQSEAVSEYLRTTHKVHKTGWWWWSTRPVRAIGVGNNPPPMPDADTLPASRVELLVFVPGA